MTTASPVVHGHADRHLHRVHAIADRERRPHRTFGVVLVRDRRAEHPHRGVADELVERAPEALDLLLRELVEGHEDAAARPRGRR